MRRIGYKWNQVTIFTDDAKVFLAEIVKVFRAALKLFKIFC